MTPPAGRPAVFLDRDGTLNAERDHLFRVEDWEWIPGAREAIRGFNRLGFQVVVVTNQAGVARGLYSEDDVRRLHAWVSESAAEAGARIDAFYHCPHHPDFGDRRACGCRKPAPGLLLKAGREMGLDLSRSFMAGDKAVDVDAARAAGVSPLLVLTGYGERERSLVGGAPVVRDVGEALRWIEGRLADRGSGAPARGPSFRVALGFGVSALCLWLAVRNVPFRDLSASLSSVRPAWIFASLVFLVLNLLARAERWRLLLGTGVRFSQVFWSQSIGALFTNLLPLRAGEVARVAALSRSSGTPAARVAASSVAERFLDMFSVLAGLGLALLSMEVPAFVRRAGAVLAAASAGGAALLAVLFRKDGPAERWILRAMEKVPALRGRGAGRHWESLREGLAAVLRPAVFLRAVSWSAAVWALSVACAWCLLRAFVADASWVEALFMTVALSLAVAVPASPGSLGVFQYVGRQALTLPFGAKYGPAAAFSAALVFHLNYYVLSSLLGAAGLARLGLPFLSLGRKEGAAPCAS